MSSREFLLSSALAKELSIKPKLNSIPSAVAMPVAFLVDAFHFLFSRKKMPLISTYIIKTASTNLHFTSTKAISEIGYRPQIAFEEGIRKTVEWYLKEIEANDET